jgi:transcriptional regulator with GAF, ATPase, and Fis domain
MTGLPKMVKANESRSSEHPTISMADSANNRIDALKSLAVLLLREVESLENNSGTSKNNITSGEKINLQEEVSRFEIELIQNALLQANGNQRVAARLLGIKATTLNAKIKRYGIKLNLSKYAVN